MSGKYQHGVEVKQRAYSRLQITERQEKFLLAYVECNSVSRAYREAVAENPDTIKDVHAWERGKRILNEPGVMARYIELKEALTLKKLDAMLLNVYRMQLEMGRVAFLDPVNAFDEAGNLKPLDEMDPDTRAAIQSVELEDRWERGKKVGKIVKVKFWDKMKALEQLGRNLQMFSEKVEVTGPGGGPVLSVDLTRLTPEQLMAIRDVQQRLRDGESTGDVAAS